MQRTYIYKRDCLYTSFEENGLADDAARRGKSGHVDMRRGVAQYV